MHRRRRRIRPCQTLISDNGTLARTGVGLVTIRLTHTGVNGHHDPSIAQTWMIGALHSGLRRGSAVSASHARWAR